MRRQDGVGGGGVLGRESDIKGTKQTVAVVATLGQVRQSSDYRSVEALLAKALLSLSRSCHQPKQAGGGVSAGGKGCALHFLKHIKLF